MFKIYGEIRFKLKIRKSTIHGFGTFANEKIPVRKKIGGLKGILISKQYARKKAKINNRIAIIELWNGLALDSSEFRNELSYINHSCNPNCFMRNIGNNVEVYALRKINVFEELTCDYGQTHHDGSLKCNCLSAKCKKYI